MDNKQIHFRAEITIEEGKTEEFKKLIQDMSRTVEASGPKTIEYQFYINGSETKCIVHETCRNSEAAIAHNDGVASQKILPRIFSISTITRFDVYGNPSEKKGVQVKSVIKHWSADLLQPVCWVQPSSSLRDTTMWHMVLFFTG